MKTDVTLFGENLNTDKIKVCGKKVNECNGVLTLGTSLEVLSGYQIVNHVRKQFF